ncbi:MAG: type II toxin-antitoxin system MqsR family toxin [Cyclobacteriaceae bacterium]
MDTKESDVESFLSGFKAKMNVFEIIYLERDKNLQALAYLEISPARRTAVIESLEAKDYYKGPTQDQDQGPDLWEFGKTVNRKEVYIKVCMGNENRPVICISFHLAERAITYPFK